MKPLTNIKSYINARNNKSNLLAVPSKISPRL